MINRYCILLIIFMISGCGSIVRNAIDVDMFKPAGGNAHIIKKPIVILHVIPDPEIYCERRIGAKAGVRKKYVGCATWNVGLNSCEIFLGKNYDLIYLGHELRHCFEGHFH